MQFRLRTLLIVLTLGPPMLATAWTNREYLLHRFDTESNFPAGLTPQAEARMRKQLAINHALHTFAGTGAVVFYTVAVLLLASVFRTSRTWWEPPKQTPLAWAAFATALIGATFALVFVLTLLVPPHFKGGDFTLRRDYYRWLSGR